MRNTKSSVNRAVSTVRSNKLAANLNPLALCGESTLMDAEGNVKLIWKKTAAQGGRAARHNDAMSKALEAYAKRRLKPIAKIKAPKRTTKDSLVAYVMGDPHIGMYAYAREAGEDFDLNIAERNLCAAIDDLVERSPAGEEALLINVGDYFHADNMQNRTERSGHSLDVDTRYPHVLEVGVRIQEYLINKLLTKHKRVRVINEIGNHDTQSAHNLILIMKGVFRNNPRVSIDDSPKKHHYYEFGQNLIGVTHGDTTKPANLPGVMAADMARAWGRTRYRTWITGHIHHSRVWEFPGVTVEAFRTLAPRDAWHAAEGYRAGRDMQSITYDREYGEVERRRADIALIEARAAAKRKRSN